MLRDATSLPEKLPRTQLYFQVPTQKEAGMEEFSKNLKAISKFWVQKRDVQRVP
jgi:hypothetical protein